MQLRLARDGRSFRVRGHDAVLTAKDADARMVTAARPRHLAQRRRDDGQRHEDHAA
jgi:hypothetical protein